MSYWDINQFLAEEQKIQFSFMHDAYQMQFLDPTKQSIISAHQTLTTPIWLVSTLYDYLVLGARFNRGTYKSHIPEDFNVKSLDRINSFRTSHRSTVEQVKIKAEVPYFYQMYQAMKKITQNEGQKFDGAKIAQFLQERGKFIISRALSSYQQSKNDPITNNYTKLQMQNFQKSQRKDNIVREVEGQSLLMI